MTARDSSSGSPAAGNTSMQNMQKHLFWSFLSSIDICHPAPWLSTGNVKGLTDDGHPMPNDLELGCAEETGTTEVLNFYIHPSFSYKLLFHKQIILFKVLFSAKRLRPVPQVRLTTYRTFCRTSTALRNSVNPAKLHGIVLTHLRPQNILASYSM